MKKKINLLLITLIPSILINCSGKSTVALPQKEPSIIPPSTQRIHRPTLGTPIHIPERTLEPTAIIKVPKRPHPIVEQVAKEGKSSFLKKIKLPNTIKETSGLIKIDNRLWTLNDSGGQTALYQIDEQNGRILKTIKILNARNYDWEDIAYDDTYIYIGDFGNNRGNRRDLKIYKIPRASLRTQKSIRAEIIHFSYSDQKNFSSRPQKNNYDCEAMIANNGKLYLFSKNWQNKKTRLYELNSNAGRHTAQYLSTFNIQGMVTGASLNKELNILLLTTYSSLLNVNVWAFTNHNGRDFFSNNAKKLNFSSPLQGQVEAITFNGNYKAYLSSEAFKKYIFSFDALLYELDFSAEFE